MPRWVLALVLVGLGWSRAAAQTPTASPSEVNVWVVSFGAGGAARPGEWCGINVGLTDTADRPRDVIVQVMLTDPDGDHPVASALVTTTPGADQSIWLSLRLPFQDAASGFDVHVRSPEDPSDPSIRSAGRLLGSTRVTPRLIPPTDGCIGLLGRRKLGLEGYEKNLTPSSIPIGAHERLQLVSDLDPGSMPDRWMPLAVFEAIVWQQGDPGALGIERAAALREWVRRGGHLIIVLPPVGQTWTNREASSGLADILPDVTIEREEGVEISRFRALLTGDSTLPLPGRMVIHRFTPKAGALPGEAIPILDGPDGDCVVARRLVGAGAVTLVGLDLSGTTIGALSLPEPDAFWHRVLGRRGDVAAIGRVPANITSQGMGRTPRYYDRDLAGQFTMSARAGAALAAGFVVFALYWLIGGPLGYFALRKLGRAHWAWVAFVLTAGVFTIVSWGAAGALAPKRVDGSHLTLLDHVYGQPNQRARSWIGLLVPWYGEATASVASASPAASAPLGTEFENAIGPWDPPGGVSSAGFPDNREYAIDARDPGSITFPARSTVKQLQVDWAGGPLWRMPHPVVSSSDLSEGELTLPPKQPNEPLVDGVLVHDLPGPLEGVVIVVVREQVVIGPRAPGGPLLADAYFRKLAEPWLPGVPLDLANATLRTTQAEDLNARRYLDSLVDNPRGSAWGGLDEGTGSFDFTSRMMGITFLPVLQPPDYRSPNPNSIAAVQREATHGWDLGRWFTQPCVMVVGAVSGGCPTPLTVEGKPVSLTQGRTFVRWVYPLSANPPRQAPAEESSGQPPGQG